MRELCFFRPGDVVELVTANYDLNTKMRAMRNVRLKLMPYKLILLKPLNRRLYLAALCKETAANTQLRLQTNCGCLYVKTKEFKIVDERSLLLYETILIESKQQAIQKIYDNHNAFIEYYWGIQQEKQRKRQQKLRLKKK